MSEYRKFIKSSFDYQAAQVLTLMASLVSFPIIVRLLSVEEYGILSLANTIVLFCVAFSKLGMQQAAIRFYPEWRKANQLPVFYSTYLTAALSSGILFSCLTILIVHWVLPVFSWMLALFIAVVVFSQTTFSFGSNFLLAEEKSRLWAAINVCTQYSARFGGIAMLYWLQNGLEGLFGAQAVSYLFASLIFAWHYRSYLHTGKTALSKKLLKDSFGYGIPLLFFELSSITLAFSDRFLISHFNGAKALGIYSAGYMICMYLGNLVRQPVAQAATPMFMRIYTRQGDEAAKAFLVNLLAILGIAVFPIFAGFLVIKDQLLLLLSSEKYAAAAPVMPWVLGAFLLYSCQPFVTAGLQLKKKTIVIARIALVCGGLNIAANVVLLPRYGIVAAAWTTLGAYALTTLWAAWQSQRIFSLRWPWKRLMLAATGSASMYFVLAALPEKTTLVVKILSGVALYGVLIFILDSWLRQAAMHMISRFSTR